MTPLQIEILFHYHCVPADYRDGDFSAPAVRDAIELFVEQGLLEPETLLGRSRAYRLTDRADAYLAHIMRLPLPVKIWVMPTIEEANP